MNELEKIKAKQAKLEKESAQLAQRIAELEKEVQNHKEKGYTWEECRDNYGYHLHVKGWVDKVDDRDYEGILSPTEKQCISECAGRKLAWIIKRLNEDFGGEENYSVTFDRSDCRFVQGFFGAWALPYISSENAYDKLIDTNTPLLKQYFGIDEKG